MNRRKAFLYANIFIFLSLIIFFSRSIFTDRLPTTTDILQTCSFFRKPGMPAVIQNKQIMDLDSVDQFIPWFQFNTDSIRSGSLPLWNPYEGCGEPHIANMQSAFFFPLNFFIYLLGMKWGLLMIYLMRLYLCGIFIYLYLSKIHIDYRASIVAALAGMFTGYNTKWLYHDNSAAAFYIPLALLAVEFIVQNQDSIKGYVLLCLGFVLALFTGHPETFFFGTTVVFLYAFIRILQEYKEKKARNRAFLNVIVFLSIGVLISGIQLIPFLEYLLYSNAYSARITGGNPSIILLSSVLPSLVPNFLSSFLGIKVFYIVFFGFFPTSTVGYTGITMFLLCIAGIAGIRHFNNNLMKSYLIIIAYIIIVAFNVPLLHKAMLMLPGFKVSWTYFLFGDLPPFIIFVGAMALDAYFKGRMEFKYFSRARTVIFVIIGIALVFFLIQMHKDIGQTVLNQSDLLLPTLIDIAGTSVFIILTVLLLRKVKAPTLLAYGLGVLVFAETALPMIPFESAIKPAYFYPKNNIIETLDRQKKPFRIAPLFKAYKNEVGPPWPVGIVQYYGLEEPSGYDAMLVNRYSRLVESMPINEFLNLANVKFIIMTKNDVPHFQGLDLKPVLSYNDYTLYENPSALNRAFVVYDYKTAPPPSPDHKLNDLNQLRLVHEIAGQLNTTATILQEDTPYATFTPHNTVQAKYDVQFEVYQPSRIKMKIDTSEPGLLVISNAYFPGWHVSVDNTEKKLIRTDYAFDGVFLEKGGHTVVLTYKPLSFRIGLILTITGLIGLLLVSIILDLSPKKR